jgi:hypothetical protein
MALFTESGRSKFESTAYTALLLAFFFAVGLAGGVLYRLLPAGSGNDVAAQDAPARAAAPATSAGPMKSAASVTVPAAPPAAATAPVKPVTAPAKIAPVPAKPPAPVSAPTTTTASAPLPESASPTPPPAALPAAIAPIATEPAPVASSVTPTSDRLTASIPAPAKPATPDTTAARPAPAAKPSVATSKPNALPEKRVAVATTPPPLAGQPVPEGAAGPVRVQFGAFAIEDNAHQIQWAVQATGLAVEITQLRTPKGRVLFYVRSQPFPDRAAAVSAATAAQNKAKSFVNPVAIDYVIVSDTAKPAQQAQAPGN